MNYTPSSIIKLSHEYDEVVPVIASFNGTGGIKPIYVQIYGETHKILGCQAQYLRPYYVFYCTILNYNQEQTFTLRYHPVEAVWTLKK